MIIPYLCTSLDQLIWSNSVLVHYLQTCGDSIACFRRQMNKCLQTYEATYLGDKTVQGI